MSGLIVDLFAGGGGASLGIELALGRDVDIAINHDAIAHHSECEQFFGRSIDLERFRASVLVADGDACWEWTGSRLKRRSGAPSYGTFSMKANGKSRNVLAHRLAWMLAEGPIDESLKVCHRCDNVLCVRRSHLFAGTQAQNLADMRAKGRGYVNRFPRGTAHPSSKIDDATVRSIRRLRANGLSFAALGDQFGMHASTVHDIVRRKTWAHVSVLALCFGAVLLRAQFGEHAQRYDMSAARTKSAKVRLIGNSVVPHVSAAIVGANLRVRELAEAIA